MSIVEGFMEEVDAPVHLWLFLSENGVKVTTQQVVRLPGTIPAGRSLRSDL